MKFPDFPVTWNFFIFQNFFPDRGNPVNLHVAYSIFKLLGKQICASLTDKRTDSNPIVTSPKTDNGLQQTDT